MSEQQSDSDAEQAGLEEGPLEDSELREFVYLDSLSVNSLLASLYMAIPDAVERVLETEDEDHGLSEVNAGINLHSILNVGGRKENTDIERELSQTTTTARINTQYRFTVLYEALKSLGRVKDLTDEDLKSGDIDALNNGDVVKIRGQCSTDPLYRVMGSAELLEEASSDSNQLIEQESVVGQRNQFYNGMVGLKVEPKNESGPFGMAVKSEDLWIDDRREFLGQQEYTVLGRIEGKIPSNREWDLIDALRVLEGFVPPDKHAEMRDEMLDEMFDNVALGDQEKKVVQEILLNDLMSGEVNIAEIQQKREELIEIAREEADESEDDFDPTEYMERKDFTLKTGYIISPIGIYW